MTTMRPEDIADMFGLPPEESTPSAAEAEEAARAEAAALAEEEAALAAELALAIASGDFAADAPDSRAKLRVAVSWPARMHLPNGRVIDLQVRNISEGGVGLMAGDAIPGYTVVDFEMDVPPPGEGRPVTVKGTIRTTYAVAHGPDVLCGATWMQVPPAGLELVSRWIDRLRP